MLIHLSDGLIPEIFESGDLPDTVIQALQNIAQARAQGDHVITGDYGVLDRLTSHVDLSLATKRVFARIRSEQPALGGLRSKLQAHAHVSKLNSEVGSFNINGQLRIEVPLLRFSRNDLCQPTFFVAENLTDCELFVRFSSWFAKTYRPDLPRKLSAVFLAGGGDTTDRALSYLLNPLRYFVLCIVDRDQSHPNGGIGETAKKCKRLPLPPTAHLEVLDVRAAENLLTYDQLVEVLAADSDRRELFLRLPPFEALKGKEAWQYLHFKDGIREHRGPHQPNTLQQYWSSVLTAERLSPIPVGNENYLVPPISSKVLRWCVDYLENNEPVRLDGDPQLKDHWEKITESVSAWLCGTDPIRV